MSDAAPVSEPVSKPAAKPVELPVELVADYRQQLDRALAAGNACPVFLVGHLCHIVGGYLDPGQLSEIREAYRIAYEAHSEQRRVSGEPYIYHPLAAAGVLAEMRLDHSTIMAALLHDVVEDTEITKEDLARRFGAVVADLVDGVSKLAQIDAKSREEAQAANLRKMVLAMARDVRVILVKLADRLHNMRTLGAMPPHKRRRIARETLDIYAPIAHRLGINALRLELEDLGFRNLYPWRFKVLEARVAKARGERKELMATIDTGIRRRLSQEGLEGRVSGRSKHLYSIYRKMLSKQVAFEQVQDLQAFRIVVDTVDTCYRVLGAMHNLYKPVPGKFKDYIAIPKSNGYQSLHTTLIGPFGAHVEVQVRTEEMDRVAKAGIAAHWLYKADGEMDDNDSRAREWLQGLLEMQRGSGDSVEFIENVKVDLFPDEVYVFSPQGDIFELPRGSTPVDFAYAVHTDVGNSCVAAKVDKRLVTLGSRLYNGQQVDIITTKGAHPKPHWLNFVVTAKARSNIRHHLKQIHQDEAVTLGRRLLAKALSGYELVLGDLSHELITMLLAEIKLPGMDALLEDIGVGNRPPSLVARRLAQLVDAGVGSGDDKHVEAPEHLPLLIRGTEGMVVSFAKCCRPIPGDQIVGYLSPGRGVVVHIADCHNVAGLEDRPDKWIDVEWARDTERSFATNLCVDVDNQRGVLATIASSIAAEDSNIQNVTIEERDGMTSSIHFVIEVRNRVHLACIMRRLRKNSAVTHIYRERH